MREQRLDQVWLVKKREVKTRDDVVNLAQDTHARSGELLRGAQGAQVSCSGCSGELLRLLRLLRWVAQGAQVTQASRLSRGWLAPEQERQAY